MPCQNLTIENLGDATIPSPLNLQDQFYVSDDNKISHYSEFKDLDPYIRNSQELLMYEPAGPRKNIYFSPKDLICGIVTCGGLCPGLNDVVRTITLTSLWQYKVKKILGFCYGYEGVSSSARCEPMELTPEKVDGIQHKGGTILGSSRGHRDAEDMINTLLKHKVNILFVIGGDGTFRGAHELSTEINKRKLNISVIGVPKTIDNDILCSEKSFGFGTAVEESRKAIKSAHNEAKSAFNGIGLVKLMGRDSGFIATHASLANSDVNFCLIPEIPVKLQGDDNFLVQLEDRLKRKNHAVIVVAEGAGQDLIKEANEHEKDASGNVQYKDIGLYLKERIKKHFKEKNMPVTVKYIDPSYTIRSIQADAQDSIYCLMLGQMAVHAGMAGKTNMFVGYWNHHFTHVPFAVAIEGRKKIDADGLYWQTLNTMNQINIQI